MKIKLLLLVLTIFTLTSCSENLEEKEVTTSFKNYKQALLLENGDSAVQYVSKNTLEYYQEIADYTRYADSIKLTKLGLLERFTILMLRFRADRSEIQNFNGKSLFIYSINKGMISKNSVMSLETGNVNVEGDFAQAEIVANGQTAPIKFEFYKEDGVWKLDLTAVFSISITGFKAMIEQSGMSEKDFTYATLETLTGRIPTNEIWKPIDYKW